MIIFIIPAYNEEKNILSLIKLTANKMQELNLPYRLIVVNDGSSDGTRSLLENYQKLYPITILDHDTNKNVGQVFRTGFQYVLSQIKTGDIVITKEADNTSDLGILNEMLHKIDKGYDVVLASCYAKGGKISNSSWDRIILSFAANLLVRILFHVRDVYTYSSFYRGYKGEALKAAYLAYGSNFIEEKGFACMIEMLIKLNRLGLKMTEVPMELMCDARKGKSKMRRMETILGYLRIIRKELFRSSKYADSVRQKFLEYQSAQPSKR